MIHLNARSLRYKIDDLTAEIENYDIVCITETWLNQNIDSNTLLLQGFHKPIRKDREDGYDGVAIYVRSNLGIIERNDLGIPTLEALWCEVHHPKLSFLIACMYRPPNSLQDY